MPSGAGFAFVRYMKQPTLALAFATSVCSGVFAAGCVTAEDSDIDDSNAEQADIDLDGKEDLFGMSPAPIIGDEPSGEPTRYPIVFAHGNAATAKHWGFVGVERALRNDGHVIQESTVPIHSVEVRAEYLAQAVDQAMASCQQSKQCDGSKVNIIAHSLGGVDARLVAAMPRFAGKIASISTIATPHRGTSVANVLLQLTTEGFRGALSKAVGFWAKSFIPAELPNVNGTAIWTSMSTNGAAKINRSYPDRADVFYQSWAGISYTAARQSTAQKLQAQSACEGKILGTAGRNDWLDPRMIGASEILAGASNAASDGLVPVTSAKWGQFNGCIPADHMDQVGRADDTNADRRTGFEHVRFFRNIAFGLAARGL
jgi:triacylglycerol lipase